MSLFGSKKRSSQNLLTMMPHFKQGIHTEKRKDGFVYLMIPRTNPIEKLSIRFLKQPSFFPVKLDELGAFVAEQIDGVKTIDEISSNLSAEFGEKASPVVPRLAKFIEMLEVNDWITWGREN
ncbi:Coenzyme PQQ synthesis protein D (PqqD) [Fictibacillus solisalsi]|uniref:Coenzyme PQQ synthesis protein D (PqqD) n=2 Tax=Fictibacillus solisalsi TaxID=459525 RepID=A0A1G9X5G2_9BACL|nr:Coenzyme PQQ synthesis protein D (PqqD) [Fictibacillus solisalsi]